MTCYLINYKRIFIQMILQLDILNCISFIGNKWLGKCSSEDFSFKPITKPQIWFSYFLLEKVFILSQLVKMRVFARSYPLFRRDKKFGDNIDYIFKEAKCRIRRMSIERELQDIRFNLRINFMLFFLRNL